MGDASLPSSAEEERGERRCRAPLAVVGIGAAAGGSDALKKFFSALPQETGIAFVVIQHAPFDQHTLGPETFCEFQLPVKSITTGMRVEADTIYVGPPGEKVTIQEGMLALGVMPQQRGVRNPIDAFFKSLARDQRQDAIGIVLSGAGGDASQGVREIKECGGMVMVQDPQQAESVPMPVSAIETGQADYVLPVEAMPAALVRYVEHNSLFNDYGTEATHYQQQITAIQHLLKFHAEYDFERYKHSTLLRRVQRRMGLLGLSDLDEYVHLLKDRPLEVETLAQDLLICVTSFFRNPDAWAALKRDVLELLVQDRPKGEPLRIWVPGCATGEEAYTMAMLITEVIGDRRDVRAQIFATDISNHALKAARAATYPDSVVSSLTPERLRKFFVRDGDSLRVTKSIREMVVFAAHDLKGDPPFFRLDLISCRNLLIYLEREAQTHILQQFHFALNPGGYLFLGSSETASRYEEGFDVVDPHARIYRRVGEGPRGGLMIRDSLSNYSRRLRPPRLSQTTAPSLRELAAQVFWQQSKSVVLLLNDKLQPVYVGGSTEPFLQIPEGEQRYTVYELLRSGIQLKLRVAIQALENESEARFDRATVRQADDSTILARGLVRKVNLEGQSGELIYVQLEEQPSFESAHESIAEIPADSGQEKLVRDLERELMETREELSHTIEQLEQANEELRAANEEAMSVNEELQSGAEELEASREELQSLNEELTTLNAQLEEKLRELENANNDLANLIASTRIAVVFLDTEFRIRNFTPEAVELFHLIRTDIGRPISDLVHKFTDEHFLEDAREVLKTLTPIQREVPSEDQRLFIRRLLPYRTHDNRIEGVVATFQDITSRKLIEEELAAQREQLRLVTDAMPALIAYIDRDERYRFANAQYEQWFDIPVAEVIGQSIREVLGSAVYEKIRPSVQRALAGEYVFWEGELPYAHGSPRYVHVEYIPNVAPSGDVLGYYALIQDVTERQHAEEIVRQSELEFRTIFELAGSGKAQADPTTGQFLRVNRRFCQITGYEAEELLQKSYSDITHPEDRERDQEQFERVLQGDMVHWTSERRFIRKTGEAIWALVTGTVVRDSQGQPKYTIATIQDVDARHKAEDALLGSEQRLQFALRTAKMGAWEIDLETGHNTWDELIPALFAVPPEQAAEASQRWLDYVEPEDRDRILQTFAEASQQGGPDYEIDFRVRRADGKLRWFSSRGVVQDTEHGRRMVGVLQDISERREAEQALREGEERFRLLADNIAQLAWMANADGWIFWYNRRWFEYTGTTLEEMQGWGWQAVHHPDHVEPVTVKFKSHMDSGQPWEDTFPLRGQDGNYRWFLSRAIPIRDEQGHVLRWFGTNTDVTDQMELEQALKEADSRKDEFLAMLAHELRNPLAPIRSGIDLLMMNPADMGEPLNIMDEQLRHMVRLVDDLLDVSRITRGTIELRWEAVSLQDVLKQAIDTSRPAIAANHLELSVELPDETIWLNADLVRLVQVFDNLLTNAVRYSKPHGRITVTARQEGDVVRVSVRDTGIGIDAELLPKIFDLFTQASRSPDREKGGLGIGLTIVKNLVELHLGTVFVASPGEGQGSEFTVMLPIGEPPEEQEPEESLPSTATTRRILVVDDSRGIRHLLTRLLQNLGYQDVETACDGNEALAKVAEFEPDVVLLDIGLPEMDGFEVARRLRSAESSKRILIVAISGYGQDRDREKSRAAGFDLHLVKPVGIHQLRELLNSYQG